MPYKRSETHKSDNKADNDIKHRLREKNHFKSKSKAILKKAEDGPYRSRNSSLHLGSDSQHYDQLSVNSRLNKFVKRATRPKVKQSNYEASSCASVITGSKQFKPQF